MAEMTAAEAIDWLTEDKAFGQECYSRKQIAQLIEQQAAEIAASEQKHKNWIGPIEHKSLLEEIAKKDRMLKVAIGKLFILPYRDECPDDVPCLPRVNEKRDPDIGDCRKCWLAWLEKEAQGVE